jgi:Fe-S cluster biogenesis protein NfuA
MRSVMAAALLALVVGCADPVHDRAVDALGPEARGVPKGPEHRPGQPCLLCHGGEGPADFVMSFGGTVYTHLNGAEPAVGAIVRVVDAEQRTYDTPTNGVGNFWIPAREFEPVFPVTAAVTLAGYSRVMRTTMRLDGSCNGCHSSPETASSPGHVWVLPDTVNPL